MSQCRIDYGVEWTLLRSVFLHRDTTLRAGKMFSSSRLGLLLGIVLVLSSIPDAQSYTKYGRTCQDIGCRRDEVCVMAEDPCSIYQRNDCGRYPTCAKARPGEASCASTVCAQNEYCKTENNVPTCVKRTTDLAYSTRRPGRFYPAARPTQPPTPPLRFSSFGGRFSGASGSRNTIGGGSIFNRIFGDDRSRTTTVLPRIRTQQGGSGYYTSHTSVDAQGNRVWTFSG